MFQKRAISIAVSPASSRNMRSGVTADKGIRSAAASFRRGEDGPYQRHFVLRVRA
jgi:hypothetical protein